MTRQRRIDRLRTTLIKATRFEEAMTQFLDLVEQDPGIVTDATPCEPKLLVHAIGLAARDVVQESTLATLSLLAVPGHALVHGTVLIGRRLATVLWFTDARVGLLAVVMSRRETRFTRFRLEGPGAEQGAMQRSPLGEPGRN